MAGQLQYSHSSSSSSTVPSVSPSSPRRRRGGRADMVSFQELRLVLSKVPLALRVAFLHILRLSTQAKYLDLRSELVVAVLRSFLQPSEPSTITKVQRLTLRDDGVKGRIWVSRYTSPTPPETLVRDALLAIIDDIGSRSDTKAETKTESQPVAGRHPCRIPELSSVEAEWTGYRAGAEPNEPLPRVSEKQLYDDMMREVSHPTTILYLHGGAYYLMDPASHRPAVKKLAKLTGGRAYSVRYRLAPQHPFPAALLDALVSYLTLLYPPPDAYHEPVKPEHIVLAGDSAGGNLALALLQVLLHLQRRGDSITWYGESRRVPLPAGVACNSPWLDITSLVPTWDRTVRDRAALFDYLPPPNSKQWQTLPPCPAWPARPPRKHLYADDDMLTHPLVNLVMAETWAGSPPTYICTGWENLAYEDKFLAQKLARRDAITVVFEEFEAMPHCFAMLLTQTAGARRCIDGWAAFIKRCVDAPKEIESSAVMVKAYTLEETPLEFDELIEMSDEEMRERILSASEVAQTAGDVPAKL